MARITNGYQTRFTNTETSWRRENVWEYEIMFEGGLKSKKNWRNDFGELPWHRTAGQAHALAAAQAAVKLPGFTLCRTTT